MDTKQATLNIDDKEFVYTVIVGTEGEKSIDASKLRQDTGYIFYDNG